MTLSTTLVSSDTSLGSIHHLSFPITPHRALEWGLISTISFLTVLVVKIKF